MGFKKHVPDWVDGNSDAGRAETNIVKAADLNRWETGIAEAHSRLESVDSSMSTLTDRMREFGEASSRNSTEISGVKSDLQATKTKLASVERASTSGVSNNASMLNGLTTRVEAAEKKIQSLEARPAGSSSKVGMASGSLSVSNISSGNIQYRVTGHSAQIWFNKVLFTNVSANGVWQTKIAETVARAAMPSIGFVYYTIAGGPHPALFVAKITGNDLVVYLPPGANPTTPLFGTINYIAANAQVVS